MSCDTYCMNHGCNRGPGCPAGTACYSMPGCKDTACPGHPGAKVARIGRKDYGREPLPRSPWRVYLKDLARSMLIVLAVIGISAAVVGVPR